MDAIALLKKDHETVKSLLSRLENTTERAVQTRKKLVQKIEQELQVHTAIEEKIFYPAFKAAGARDEAILSSEAKEEHRAVDSLVLPDIMQTSPEHHIEEEETDMFPQASKLLGKQKLLELGAEMEALQKTLKQGQQAKAA
jgi:hemerythrin-like domain-containing protein